jgi:hypothetical protein
MWLTLLANQQLLEPAFPVTSFAFWLPCRVGFNSVYHVTDLPGFVSGEHLVFFDPHCKYLPAISAANPGKKINFVAHPVNSQLADQVAPFQFFGCDTCKPFQGTLFRFPLRTQTQADASTISKQVGHISSSLLNARDARVGAWGPLCSLTLQACPSQPACMPHALLHGLFVLRGQMKPVKP